MSNVCRCLHGEHMFLDNNILYCRSYVWDWVPWDNHILYGKCKAEACVLCSLHLNYVDICDNCMYYGLFEGARWSITSDFSLLCVLLKLHVLNSIGLYSCCGRQLETTEFSDAWLNFEAISAFGASIKQIACLAVASGFFKTRITESNQLQILYLNIWMTIHVLSLVFWL